MRVLGWSGHLIRPGQLLIWIKLNAKPVQSPKKRTQWIWWVNDEGSESKNTVVDGFHFSEIQLSPDESNVWNGLGSMRMKVRFSSLTFSPDFHGIVSALSSRRLAFLFTHVGISIIFHHLPAPTRCLCYLCGSPNRFEKALCAENVYRNVCISCRCRSFPSICSGLYALLCMHEHWASVCELRGCRVDGWICVRACVCVCL